MQQVRRNATDGRNVGGESAPAQLAEMPNVQGKADLIPAEARLVEMMQRINYGRILGLSVRHGEPVMDPPPRIFHEYKFPGDNGARPEATKVDFALKAQVRDLFAQLEAMGNGVVRSIEIQRGLPFRMTVEEEAA